MAYRKLLHYSFCFLVLVSPTIFSSCEKFSGDQTIPAYITIDSISLATDYTSQGTSSHAITDGWVYVDEELIGAFQLPARFPVLKEGSHRLSVLPGVKKDGIASTRINYLFYAPVINTVTLVPDSSLSLGILQTQYETTTQFLWREDFEDIAVSLDTTPRSTVGLKQTPSGSPLTFEGNHSGIVNMDSVNDYFECVSHKNYTIPSAPVFLEMNFNTNNKLIVGVMIYTSLAIYQVPIITLFETNNRWKKIYIDLTTTLNAYSGSLSFKVFLANFMDTNIDHAQILFDNFKLVTRGTK